ncbi:MAG: hypothetical protein KBC64_03445 [Simkaniaceae bacterium]|nr:hypothetical protein [Simkaniaceae bacterium]
MAAPISSQFSINLETEASKAQKDLTFYKTARIASFIALAILQIGAIAAVHFFAPHLTLVVLSGSLAIIPTVCGIATSKFASKIYKSEEQVHYFSGAAAKEKRANRGPVAAQLEQLEEDLASWNLKKQALMNALPQTNQPYSLRKKIYLMNEFRILPLKIQAAYFSHLLYHPREQGQSPLDFGAFHLMKSYKQHLDLSQNSPTPPPLFTKKSGEAISRQTIENETINEIRIHLFGN